ncbi:MAG: hypothetical protein LBO71_07335 [Prevotellaceae bacterium]|jgi:hypothetical protein|nr:hypothetical protein [Prevotellaceae bacterium]
MANQPQENCLECTQHRGHTCPDVHALLIRLNIPPQEQVALWRVASEKVGCAGFKNILSSLQNRLAELNFE